MKIVYDIEPQLGAEEFIDVLVRSGLGRRRPVDDAEKVRRMLEHANLVITARDQDQQGLLVGVSRCATDFACFCYCADLAVDQACQRMGIGKLLMIRSWRAAGQHCSFFLLSAPDARGFYERVKMPLVMNAYGFVRPHGTLEAIPEDWA